MILDVYDLVEPEDLPCHQASDRPMRRGFGNSWVTNSRSVTGPSSSGLPRDPTGFKGLPRASTGFQAAKSGGILMYFAGLRQADLVSFLWNWRSWGLLGSWSLYGECLFVYLGRLVLICVNKYCIDGGITTHQLCPRPGLRKTYRKQLVILMWI